MPTSSRQLGPLLAVAALLLSACGDDTSDGGDTGGEVDTSNDVDTSDGGDPSNDVDTGGADLVDVQVGSTVFGDVLVDTDGMTLYLFTNDSDGHSACYDGCAAAWPPLTIDADEVVAGDGVDAGLLGTTDRDDGATQVTYDGWPLYTWASDGEPGDVTGQGVNDVWFVVAPDGEAIMDDDASPDPAGY